MFNHRFFKLYFLPALMLMLTAANLSAHGDEIPTDPGVAKDHFTAYGLSDRYELTLYHSEITAGQETHLTLFVAESPTNRPLDKAELKVGLAEAPGTAVEVTPVSAGVYELHITFPENKKYTLNVQVSHPNGADLIAIQGVEAGKKMDDHHDEPEGEHADSHWWWMVAGIVLGGLLMWFITRNRNRTLISLLLFASAYLSAPAWNPAYAHGDEEHGPKTGGSGFGKSVYAPKETQFLFEILTQQIAVGDYHSATTMFGTIIPASGGMGVVVAPQSGKILRMNVAVGQQVRAGQTLAVLQQNVSAADQVGIAANNTGLAVQTETARVRAEATRKERDRLKKIADIAAAKDIQAAEAAYNQALTELQTLENKAINTSGAANNRTITLTAPISGIVGAFTLTAGAEVTAGQNLLTVTNLNKVYVEAQVYDRDVPVVRAGNKFLVQCSTDDHKSAEVRLISPAQTMNPGNQSQRVLFEMDNPRGEFKIGEFVTVKALNNSTSRQITVPNSALTEINGKTAIFIKEGPEMFTLSYVQTGEDDGTRTLILKGIEQDEKVVINGAYEVKMMYLNQ